MGNWLSPMSRGRAVVRTPPVMARYLEDLAQRARQMDALEDARRLDIHFGRVAPEDPFAGVDVDPIADMVGATGAPRSWLEAADYNKAIDDMMPAGPQEPFADVLRRNDRTRALKDARLDRLTPEQRVSSLGVVSRQAEADAAAARRQQGMAGELPFDVPAGLTAAALLAAGGAALKARDDASARAREEANAAEAARQEAMAKARGEVEADLAERQYRKDLDVALAGDADGAMPMTIDIGEESPISGFDPFDGLDIPVPDVEMDDATKQFVRQFRSKYGKPQEIDIQGLLQDETTLELTPDSPDEAVANAPGPASPVSMNRNLEDLPGPQMRSVRALMRAGIPESRAMAIIVKGSSMTPDETRMVTGGRR